MEEFGKVVTDSIGTLFDQTEEILSVIVRCLPSQRSYITHSYANPTHLALAALLYLLLSGDREQSTTETIRTVAEC